MHNQILEGKKSTKFKYDFKLKQIYTHRHAPACSTAACTVIAPSRVAGIDDKEPRNEPIGVRTALAITTSCTYIIMNRCVFAA